ncbi:MAG: hypothetical protein QXQ33_03795, partial [Nitrososphaerota archaeon]
PAAREGRFKITPVESKVAKYIVQPVIVPITNGIARGRILMSNIPYIMPSTNPTDTSVINDVAKSVRGIMPVSCESNNSAPTNQNTNAKAVMMRTLPISSFETFKFIPS